MEFVIFVTAHNPLFRFDALLETLRGYEELPGEKDVFIHIDYEHAADEDTLKDLLAPNVEFRSLKVLVASSVYKGFDLTWAHKPLLEQAAASKMYDFYVYTENDMLFTRKHFDYWYEWKDKLKPLNLEPGFCRYELSGDKLIPFDNHRVWELNKVNKKVWGDVPYRLNAFITPYSDFLGFVNMPNPYQGMMILDQDMVDVYINSISSNPVESFKRVQVRCWPIADRSSLGTAFENLLPGQDHRRVVPLIEKDGTVQIASCGLIRHLDTKYSDELSKTLNSVLDTTGMFGL